MRRLCMALALVLALPCLAHAQPPSPAADDWTGTPEQKVRGLATIWAEATYAFPSWEQLPDLDWDASFEAFVPRVIAAPDRDAYYWILMEFAGLLNDGHTSVLPPWGYVRMDWDHPPLEAQVVEDALVVARAADTPELREQGIAAGVEILQIEGRPAREYFDDRIHRFYPRGSQHANDALNTVYLLRGPKGSEVSLKIRDLAGAERDVTLTRDCALPTGAPFLPRVLQGMMMDPPLVRETLEGGVEYLRIAQFQDPSLAEQFLALVDGIDPERTKGLVIDLRFALGGSSRLAEQMIGALIDEPVSSPQWKYPHYVAARENWGHEREWSVDHKMIPPREGRHYDGPVVILTSGITSSTAEDFAISLREAGRATLVGENTAGSAGNPLSRPLPGGGSFQMATFRALLPDGGEYVGTGVEPDVRVAPTKQELRDGVDAALAKALELLAP